MNKSAHDIILHPLLTEKSSHLREEEEKVCFVVRIDANKIEIREAVERIFDVKVASVRTQVMRGKVKRMGQTSGKRPNWKKAIVSLTEGQIEFFEG